MSNNHKRLIRENIAPKGAKYVGIVQNGQVKGRIPIKGTTLEHNYGKKLYSFAVMSDIHLSDYNLPDGLSTRFYVLAKDKEDFQAAVKWVNDHKEENNIDMMCLCGDFSRFGTENELNLYSKIVGIENGVLTGSEYNYKKIPAYTCHGNHDLGGVSRRYYEKFAGKYESGAKYLIWKKYTGMDILLNGETLGFQVINHGDDHFIFFSLDNPWGTDGKMKTVYDGNDVKSLDKYLSAHKDERCFIFTHLFFPDCAGAFGHIYRAELDGESFSALTNLRKKYPNVVWFSGHSHWHWEMQGQKNSHCAASKGMNRDANIYPVDGAPREGAWTVHIPSCGDPRNSTETDPQYGDGDYVGYDPQGDNSQFALVDVYSEGIVINGISLEGQKTSRDPKTEEVTIVTPGTYKYKPIGTYFLKIKGGNEPEELPIVGEVGENNVITLTDDVPDDYTLCYLDENETELTDFERFDMFQNA